jgi:radical SAM superfamily enzyme YgiQ (UPF0313 family)
LNLIREARERKKTVVVGGPYATSVPGEALDAGADLLVRGEAETVMPLLMKALERGESGVVLEPPDKPEMTASPIPRFDLANLQDYLAMGIQTSRGCPFDCEFCDITNLFGRRIRYKTPAQVLAELQTLYNLGWRENVFICDDNFIGSPEHARAILLHLIPWMKGHGEPFDFWTQTSVNLGQDLELIDLMTEANFLAVLVGVESADDMVLAHAGKHQNIKNPLIESLSNLGANGLLVIASFIIGLDQEEPGIADRICALVEQSNIPLAMINLLQVYPNTKLWQRLEQEGRLLPEMPLGDFHSGLNFRPSRPQVDILADFRATAERLGSPSALLARAYRAILAMRPTRSYLGWQSGQTQAIPTPQIQPENPRPIHRLYTLPVLFRLLWRVWVRVGQQGQFWRQLAGVYRRNPSRLQKYLFLCAFGYDLSHYWEELFRPGQRTSDVGPPK